MAKLDDLKGRIAAAEKKERSIRKATEDKATEIDMKTVEKIVKRMRKRYHDEGMDFEEVKGPLKELRGIIAEGMSATIEIQTIEELKEVKSKIVNFLAKIYLTFGAVLKPLARGIGKFPEMEMLSFYLYSANMHYSSKQYLAITVSASTIVFIISLLGIFAALTLLQIELVARIVATFAISTLLFLISTAVLVLIPKQRAIARGAAVSTELPFALRHMATELRAGIGLYRTIQAVATADYGPLSEEFARVITEVEEGTDTEAALKHLALRTQSKALRNAIIHIARALKTGGNLSESMNDIAEDVAFNMRMAVSEFGQRMNFFGVIFIFGAIVFPVMVGILGSIRNSAIQSSISSFKMLPLTPPIMAVIYLIVMPILLAVFIFYIKSSQPRV